MSDRNQGLFGRRRQNEAHRGSAPAQRRSTFEFIENRSMLSTALRANALRAGVLLVLGLVASSLHAQTLTTLLSFTGTGGAYPGASPQADLAISGSTLYGTTNLGGPDNVGTVFSVATNGSSFNSFNCGYGEWPAAGVTVGGSTLYGTTDGGGLYWQNGTVFSIATSGGSATTLGSFNGFDGGNPIGGLTLNGSTLYGTATGGGPSGDGTVFSIATSGGSPTALCTFNLSNGASP